MADNSSRLFTPPMDRVPDSDPMLVRVPMKELDWANRPSQQKPWGSGWMTVKNLSNGK